MTLTLELDGLVDNEGKFKKALVDAKYLIAMTEKGKCTTVIFK